MPETAHIRWGWLKFMYIYTIAGAGAFGAGIIVAPGAMQAMFQSPSQDPIVFGFVGSVCMAFAFLSILGLRDPLKFAPVLVLQLCYKVVWLIGVVVPLLIAGRFPGYATPLVVIFATYVAGDLIAIPFHHVFAGRTA